MKCPKCQSEMYTVAIEGYNIDRCSSCEGLWFQLLDHEHLKEVLASSSIDCALPAKGKQYNDIRNYDCPQCTGPMIKISIPEQPHIKVEQCSICSGIYFDAGEFTDYKHFTLAERVKLIFSTFKK